MITEGEFDALIVRQIARNLVSVASISIGSGTNIAFYHASNSQLSPIQVNDTLLKCRCDRSSAIIYA